MEHKSIVVLEEDKRAMWEIMKGDEPKLTFEEFTVFLNDPVEFNNGCCVAFAEHFAIKLEGALLLDSSSRFDEVVVEVPNYKWGTWYHEYIYWNGRYYDYEALDGVERVGELPFFKRIKARQYDL